MALLDFSHLHLRCFCFLYLSFSYFDHLEFMDRIQAIGIDDLVDRGISVEDVG